MKVDPQRSHSRARGALVRVVVTCIVAAGITGAGQVIASAQRLATPAFGWFQAAAAPAGWKHARVPIGNSVLWYPPSLKRLPNNPVSLTAAEIRGGKYLAYLNVTPQEGAETSGNWPNYRLSRLKAGGDRSVVSEGSATGLVFRNGASATCVQDRYIASNSDNAYREIACLVTSGTTGSVLVGAAPLSGWTAAQPSLRQAIEAYDQRS